MEAALVKAKVLRTKPGGTSTRPGAIETEQRAYTRYLEAKPYATSYIPTTNSKAVRAPDDIRAPANFDFESRETRLLTQCSRASLATYMDGDRLVVVPANTPRWTPKGLLIEEGYARAGLIVARDGSCRALRDTPRRRRRLVDRS